MPPHFQLYNINKLKYLHCETPVSYGEITKTLISSPQNQMMMLLLRRWNFCHCPGNKQAKYILFFQYILTNNDCNIFMALFNDSAAQSNHFPTLSLLLLLKEDSTYVLAVNFF